MRKAIVPAALLLLGGCAPFSDAVYEERLDGPYRLLAIDDMAEMMVVWEIPGGGMVGDGLPGPGVVHFGQDERYLVAAVHPLLCQPTDRNCTQTGVDPTRTEYWYVVRSRDEVDRLPYAGIKGPFTRDQFAAESRRHSLPAFTRSF